MDLVNISRSRRFLRERPIRVNLFDRPRLVCDLLCLEAEQTEKRRGLATSDSLYVVMEGKARLTTGLQVEELEEQDAALVPPGVDHTIENTGPGRLTVMALVTPKPSRAAEVRMPAEGRPRRTYADEDGGSARYTQSRESTDGEERSPRRPPPRRFDGPAPQRGRDRPPARRGFNGPPPSDQRPPRSRPTVNRQPRGETEQEGPAWFPKTKPAWRPRGAPPAAGGRGGGGRPSGPSRGRSGGPAGQRGRPDRSEGPRRESGGERGRTGENRSEAPPNRRGPSPSSSRPAPRGGNRGRPAPRPNGRPAPGRSGPRTSGRRQSRES
jgi:Cupin domain